MVTWIPTTASCPASGLPPGAIWASMGRLEGSYKLVMRRLLGTPSVNLYVLYRCLVDIDLGTIIDIAWGVLVFGWLLRYLGVPISESIGIGKVEQGKNEPGVLLKGS